MLSTDWGVTFLNLLSIIVGVLVIVELIFYIYVNYWIAYKAQVKSKTQVPLFNNPEELMKLIFNNCDALKSYSFDKFITGIFLKTGNIDNVSSKNFDSFLAWAIFTKRYDDLSKDELDRVENLRKFATEKFGVTWKSDFNPLASHLRFNLEDVTYIHRPFMLYGLLSCMEFYSNIKNYYFNGFQKCQVTGGATYWIRVNSESRKTPVLVFHGICTGWYYYFELVKAIGSDRTIILYDYNCIKMNSMVFEAPTAIEVHDNVIRILKRHNIETVSLLGHSWGTILACWIIRMSPQLVSHITLVDPISLAALFPDATYTLLYKIPKSFADYLICYFVRYDLTLSHMLHRHLCWYNVAMTLDEIPDHIGVSIGLSALDELVSFHAISELTDISALKRSNKRQSVGNGTVIKSIRKIIWPSLDHGDAITNKDSINDILKQLHEHDELLLQDNKFKSRD